jgi:hypothetical protein
MTFLRGMFPGRLILRFGVILWPARSPDLTALDFFLWGYLKYKVYATRLHSTQELKDCIVEGIGTIYVAILQRLMQNFRQLLPQCIECYGGHLKQVIFRK